MARHLRVLKRPLPCEQLFANEAFSSILTHNTENFSNALILSCAPALFPSLVMTHFSAPYGKSLMRLCRIRPRRALHNVRFAMVRMSYCSCRQHTGNDRHWIRLMHVSVDSSVGESLGQAAVADEYSDRARVSTVPRALKNLCDLSEQ